MTAKDLVQKFRLDTLSKGLIAVFLAAVVLALLTGAWFYRFQARQMREKAEHELEAIAQLKITQITAWREHLLSDAAVLMRTSYLAEAIDEWLDSPTPDKYKRIESFFDVLREHQHYHDVLLLDTAGVARLSLNGYAGEAHPPTIAALATALTERRPMLTDLHFFSDGRLPHVCLVAPVFRTGDTNSDPVGVVVMQVDAERFLYPLIQSWPSPSASAETLLVRRDGDDALFLNELRHQSGTALTLRIPLSRTEVPAVMAIQGREGIVPGLDYRGVPVLSVLKSVPDTSWYMVSKVDADEIFAVWRYLSAIIIALTLIAAALLIAAAGMLIKGREAGHYRAMAGMQAVLYEAETRYRITLMSIGDAVIVADVDGRIEMMNPVAETLTGWPLKEARGRPLVEVFRIINEDTRHAVESPVARVLREGLVVGLANHTLLVARDGVERPIADSGAPIHDADDVITGVVLVFRDQTAEREAERALSDSEALYRFLADNTADCIWKLDMNLNVQYVNPAIYPMTGYTVEEYLGTPITKHFDDQNLARILDVARALVARAPDTASVTIQVETLAKDGTPTPVEVCGRLLLDENGRPAGFQGVTRDITERLRSQQTLEAERRRFKQILDAFPSGIYIVDAHYNLEYVNPALERLFGLPGGPKCYEYFHCRETPCDHCPNARVFAGELVVTEWHSNAVNRDYVLHDIPLENSNGSLSKMQVFHDVTDIKRVEGELQKRERFVREVLDSLDAHIAVLDGSGVIISVNAAWRDFAQANNSPDENAYLGENYLDVCRQALANKPEDSVEAALEGVMSVMSGARESFYFEYSCHSPDEQRWFSMHVSPLGGEEEGVVIAHHNITARILAEQSLARRARNDAALAALATEALKPESGIGSVYPVVLRYARAITGSRHGLVATIDRKSGVMTVHSHTEMLGRECRLTGPDARITFERNEDGRYPALWGYALNTRRPFYTNAPGEHPASMGLPTGHIPLDNFLAVPVIAEGELIGYVAAANADSGYTDDDLDAICRLADVYGLFLRNRLTRKQLQETDNQLRQIQKMEAVGRLAGGVAHDFNNMLGAILGYVELAITTIDGEQPLGEYLEEIRKAARRSADLTRQLLAFARKQTIMPVPLDVNEVVTGMIKMLRRLIGEDITLNWKPGNLVHTIMMDVAQMDQILANLVVNARDAIEPGGFITIATENAAIDEAYCDQHEGFVPGDYAALIVSDNGCGMDKATQASIFEPFFTTKEQGKGTGLGLSTVYGIVKQNHGFINVYSEPRQGTTFRIYLPRIDVAPENNEAAAAWTPAGGDAETILLVEDERAMLNLAQKILASMGYTVIATDSPVAAVRAAREHEGHIDLLLTDVIMPGMNGRELLEQIQRHCPGIRCLYMSGYTANVIAHHGVLDQDVHFIEKPFTQETLARKIREALIG